MEGSLKAHRRQPEGTQKAARRHTEGTQKAFTQRIWKAWRSCFQIAFVIEGRPGRCLQGAFQGAFPNAHRRQPEGKLVVIVPTAQPPPVRAPVEPPKLPVKKALHGDPCVSPYGG
eukprot:290210-Pelagomonas_calceolata.AAC.1